MRNVARSIFLSNTSGAKTGGAKKSLSNSVAPTLDIKKLPDSTEINFPISLILPFLRDASIIIDTREQLPYEFPYKNILTIKRAALPTGDYSVEGFENVIIVERKSLEDFLNSVTNDHDRFFNEVRRLSKIPFARIVVEGSIEDIFRKHYRNMVSPSTVVGNIFSIECDFNVPIAWTGNRQNAVLWTLKFLEKSWRACGAKTNKAWKEYKGDNDCIIPANRYIEDQVIESRLRADELQERINYLEIILQEIANAQPKSKGLGDDITEDFMDFALRLKGTANYGLKKSMAAGENK